MLQAWMILPALASTYLIAAPTPLRRRLTQLTVAGVVMLLVSLSWVALYTLTPAQDRGSQRPTLQGAPSGPTSTAGSGGGLPNFSTYRPGSGGDGGGWTKLFGDRYAS